MSVGDHLRRRWPKDWPLQIVPRVPWTEQQPTYHDARPAVIEAALDRSQRRPTGNWFVFAASRGVRADRPLGVRVAGRELVAWRDRHRRLHVGPGSCPHLGADLATGTVRDGVLFCRWHGLAFDGSSCELGWRPLPSYDDGVLAWVRLDAVGGEPPLNEPVIPARPTGDTLQSVTRLDGSCEPSDIIANRLDPWHGAWFHPYSFSRLEVLTTPTEEDDRFLLSVTFRMGRFGVPVIAEFTAPEARTVLMRIVEGEGTGSVVETHATPTGPGPDGRPGVAVIEATIAASQRPGFKRARRAAPVITPLMRYAAARLWRDDLGYAERRYRLRAGGHE
jgi:nitrite reductase/ring-hydroxylating ferredoxin subunit